MAGQQDAKSTDCFRLAAWGHPTKIASSLQKGDPGLGLREAEHGEYTDGKESQTRQTLEIPAQTILRISKLAIGEQVDAAEPGS
jgi:hypothetical protein